MLAAAIRARPGGFNVENRYGSSPAPSGTIQTSPFAPAEIPVTKHSTLKPFAPGDIFLGCTYLMNVPDDDHAGEGRILQFDRHLVPRGTLYTEGTTHLLVNLRFGPDGVLWAFDPFAHAVVRVSPEGHQLPPVDFGGRAWGNVVFPPEGGVVFGEYLRGDKPYTGGHMRLLADSGVVGYGRIARFGPDFRPVAEYEGGTAPSLTGFHGITHSVLHPDGRTLTYITDLGFRVYRFDLVTGQSLPDLVALPDGPENRQRWTTGVAYRRDGTLLLLRGSFIDLIDGQGRTLRTVPLDEYGYAMITASPDDRHALCANIFTGVMSRVDLETGQIVGQIDTGLAKPQRSLAGVAEYSSGSR